MFDYITNPWLIGLVVLLTQFIFLYLRTLNVIYVAEKRLIPALITGTFIGIAWLVAITFSFNAVVHLQWQPIVAYIIGGIIGTYQALVQEIKKDKK